MRFGSGARAVGVLSLAALWPDSVAAFRHSAVVRTGRGGCLLGPASHARQLSAGAPRRALTVAPRSSPLTVNSVNSAAVFGVEHGLEVGKNLQQRTNSTLEHDWEGWFRMSLM